MNWIFWVSDVWGWVRLIATIILIVAIILSLFGRGQFVSKLCRWIFATSFIASFFVVPDIVASHHLNFSLSLEWRAIIGLVGMSFFSSIIQKSLFVVCKGNEVKVVNNPISVLRDENGIKHYLFLKGGLNAVYPWDQLEASFDLARDQFAPIDFSVEMSGAIVPLKGRVDFAPDFQNLQRYFATGSSGDPKSRDEFISRRVSAYTQSEVSALLSSETFSAVKANPDYYAQNCLHNLRRTDLECQNGIRISSVKFADIGLSARVQDAYDEGEISRRRVEAFRTFLDAYSSATGSQPSDELQDNIWSSMLSDENFRVYRLGVKGLENARHIAISTGGGAPPAPGSGTRPTGPGSRGGSPRRRTGGRGGSTGGSGTTPP